MNTEDKNKVLYTRLSFIKTPYFEYYYVRVIIRQRLYLYSLPINMLVDRIPITSSYLFWFK